MDTLGQIALGLLPALLLAFTLGLRPRAVLRAAPWMAAGAAAHGAGAWVAAASIRALFAPGGPVDLPEPWELLARALVHTTELVAPSLLLAAVALAMEHPAQQRLLARAGSLALLVLVTVPLGDLLGRLLAHLGGGAPSAAVPSVLVGALLGLALGARELPDGEPAARAAETAQDLS